MNDYAVVSNKVELKRAIENKTKQIIVTNADLASNIKTVRAASKATLAIAITAAGVAATNFWNPAGWGAGAVGFVAAGSTVTAIITLGGGAAIVYAIYRDFSITGKCRVTTPDGAEYEAEIVMEKK
ncbi:hypothetical protein SAMN06297280_3428 [Arsukibacterium tuosuense]|uniref:Transmembrane protein n=1 Tax=Arsukibacterium tuosuense TaxID=1323745 RepID=A0A285JE37_9GAMM|nr:hypothetical protein [Arsukibacterium tuosuense]SNY58528.1 hypothetical protein SAMN06297280_3428 [Arsukibacterium tuosuense]